MTVGRRFGVLVMLAIALPIGVICAIALLRPLHTFVDTRRAMDWVVTPATVVDEHLTASSDKKHAYYRLHATYRYEFRGTPYASTRLGIDRLASNPLFGTWNAEVQELAKTLHAARSAGAAIPVYVNPADPAEAVVLRNAPEDPMGGWSPVVFSVLLLVTLAFMAGPVAAMYRPSDAQDAALSARDARDASGRGKPIRDSGVAGVLFLWVLAIVWNGISFPAAILEGAKWLESGAWAYLFVVGFPLIGLCILWGTIHATWTWWRRGKAELVLDPAQPRVGAAFQGAVRFGRAKPVGERYKATVGWARTPINRSGKAVEKASGTMSATAAVIAGAGGESRLAFRVEIPETAEPTGIDYAAHTKVSWQVEVERETNPVDGAFHFPVTVVASDAPPPPPPQGAGDALEVLRAQAKWRTARALGIIGAAYFVIGALVYGALL